MSNGFDNMLIVVDHLTRMPHFLPCIESVTAEETVSLFLHGVYKIHGLPRVLASDRDPKPVSGYWQPPWTSCPGTRLNMSSSRHPKTDRQTERVNNTFHQFMPFFCCYGGSI
jgi:hypothetical protein